MCLVCSTSVCLACEHPCIPPPEITCHFCSGEIEPAEKHVKSWCGHNSHIWCRQQLSNVGLCCAYPASKSSWLLHRAIINETRVPVERLMEDEHFWVLSLLYKHGTGVAKSAQIADKYMKLAVEQGNHDALVEQSMADTANAVSLLRRAITWVPNNGNANVALYHRSDAPDDERSAALDAAVAVKHPGGLYLKARALLKLGRSFEEAFPLLSAAADQEYFLAIEALIEYYRRRNDLSTAMKYTERRLAIKQPLSASCCVTLGRIYEQRNMKKYAVQYFTLGVNSKEEYEGGKMECTVYLEDIFPKGRKCDPKTALALLHKHAADGADLDLGRAKRLLKFAEPLDMGGELYLAVGMALQDTAILQRASDRGVSEADWAMAKVHCREQDFQQARVAYMKALACDRNGEVFLEAGNALMDEALLREAGSRGQPEGYFRLGHLLFAQGNPNEARRAFMQSLRPGKVEFDRSKSAKALIQLFS